MFELPGCNPVYPLHVRLFDLSLHANPWIQTPPILHVEGLHIIQWLLSDPKQLSSTVLGDGQRFAFKDHDSGKLIPHLPLPPSAGPFLLDTLQGSKYQILFHQPKVLLDGQPIGVFKFGIAPPWYCTEVKLPLPRFLARAGRGAAARGAAKKIEDARRSLDEKLHAQQEAEQLWAKASSLQQGMAAVQKIEGARREQVAAEGSLGEALNQEERRAVAERHGRLLDEEASARAQKRESDRLSRKGFRHAARLDEAALAISERAVQGGRAERAEGLASAAEQHARAGTVREGAQVWAQAAREHEKVARERRKAAQRQRSLLREQETVLAKARGRKKENPVQQATGESNAGMIAPSLLAHLPFPATVEIPVSWAQIGKMWLDALVSVAAEALKYYVGFVVDGVLAPGKGKVATALLDVLKSGVNDTLIDGGAKFLTESTWQAKVSTKWGPVKVGLQCEPDPAVGANKWKVTVAPTAKGNVLPAIEPKVSIEGHGFAPPEKISLDTTGGIFPKPTVDYASGVPAVN